MNPSQEVRPLDNPAVTVAVISFNGMKVVESCLDSILAQTYQPYRILLINNASTDGTPELIRQKYPQVEMIDLPENRGPNPARNMGIKKSLTSLTLLVDDDAVLADNCLKELVKAYQTYPHGAVWIPRLIYYDQQDLIQYEGAFIHYISEAILLNSDKPLNEGVKDITPVEATSGTCLLISNESAQTIGFFDEDYFFGRTDGEFTFRLTLSGYKLYTVPQATCFHRVKVRGLSKLFYQVRNRWYFTLSMYSWRTLLLIFPALIVYELSLIIFVGLKGAIKEYISAIFHVIHDIPLILRKRKFIQSLRKVRDRDILHSDSINIRSDLVDNKVIALLKVMLDQFFSLYWKLIYPVV